MAAAEGEKGWQDRDWTYEGGSWWESDNWASRDWTNRHGWWSQAYDWWGNRSWDHGDSGQASNLTCDLPALQSLLQRGHTVDHLSEEELQKVVADIDKLRSKPKGMTQDLAANSGNNDDSIKGDASKAAAASEHPHKPSSTTEASKDETKEDSKTSATKKVETKDERRKRLHARNMRFYRSFTSNFEDIKLL